MGALNLPSGGSVYVDTSPIIYSVEREADYETLLQPLWDAMDAGALQVVTSELTPLESLVKPTRDGAVGLAQDYETFLTGTKLELRPITTDILRSAAKLRAATRLRTPDAIHVATALVAGCSQFITNDTDFRKITSIEVVILKELI